MNPELLATIATLLGMTSDEVAALSLEEVDERLFAAFETAAAPEDGSAPVLETLTAIADATEGVRAAIATALTAEAELAQMIEEQRARVAPVAEDPEPGTETDPAETPAPAEEPAPVEEPAPDAPAETPTEEPAEARVPVAASVVPMRARRPESHRPIPTENESMVTITAAADVPGRSAGSPLRDLREVAVAFADRVEGLRGSRGVTGKVPVARMRLNFPEDRILTGKDDNTVLRLIENVTSPKAIAAAGGLCAPVAIRYMIENVSVDARPVRDSLPRFNADRGGVQVPSSAPITAVNAGVGVITEAQDAANTLKPCVVVSCPTFTTVDVSAVYQCVEVGNFSRRTFPELFDHWWAKAGALHARKGDSALLDGMAAVSTKVSDGQNLGAARDIIESLLRATAQRRSFHRMDPDAPFHIWTPAWIEELMRADLIRNMPGGPIDRFTMADSMIDDIFKANNINVTYYLDSATGEGQIYGDQGVGALLGWNLTPVTFIAPEGDFLFLDGGTLDFGTEIRDTDTNERNVVRAFLETFENIAWVGEVKPLQLTSNVCINGAAGALASVVCGQAS